MIGLSVLALLLALTGVVEDVPPIRDLSPQIRVDLVAAATSATPGQDVSMEATLTNTSSAPIAIVPMQLFAYVNWYFEPRCPNIIGATGQRIAEGRIRPVERDAIVLKPRTSVSRKGTFAAPDAQSCNAGGSCIIQVQYCQFSAGTVAGLRLLEGCVHSNAIVVEIKPHE